MEKLEPKLRFPEFKDNENNRFKWEKKTLGEIGEIISGLTYSPKDVVDDGLLVLRSSNIQNNKLSFIDNVFVKVKKYNPVKANDILICVRNGSKNLIGKNALITDNENGFAFGAFMTIYRSKYNHYIFQWMQHSTYKEYVNKNLGATINSINGNDLKKFLLPFPSLEEQTKIAEFLGSVDKQLELLNTKKEKLSFYKKGVMHQLFTQQLRFKDDNGNDYPEWEEKTLGDVGTFIGGGTPSTNNSEYWKDEINWFTPSEINSKYITQSRRKISKLGLQKSSAKFLKKGTILLTTRATIGECSILKIEASTNQGFQSLQVNEKNENEFLYYWIYNNKNEFYTRASGSTFLEISKKNIEIIPIKLPVLKEQIKIANFLSAIDKQIETVETEIAKTEVYKKGLLQQMFA